MKHIKLFEQFIAESENTYPDVFVDSDGNPLVSGKKYFAPSFKEVLIPSFEGMTVILKVDGKNSMYEMTPYDFKSNFKGVKSKLKLQESFIAESEDLDGFMDTLQSYVNNAGGYLYMDSESDELVFAISKTSISESDVEKMFDTGRPAKGATMFYIENSLGEIESKLKSAISKMGLKINVNQLFQTYGQ